MKQVHIKGPSLSLSPYHEKVSMKSTKYLGSSNKGSMIYWPGQHQQQ